ncbi:MAG: MFS transporter [Alphaproteobacteria bacterium]|nr:MFS transporter [Alphaproteobacteria bacterium]
MIIWNLITIKVIGTMKPGIIKSIISSSIGNVLEWYEYTLYAYFATVISSLFFPADNQYISMMLTFSTFAVGLAARPIGGIIFGHIGDKVSRKSMLVFSMLLMTIPTFCIGILPTYEQIGFFAPATLILLRIIQGIALGGEFGASCTYLYEFVPNNKKGFFGTLALTGVGCGLVLSSCTIFIIEACVSKETIYAYAWRIPFFISVFGAVVAFFMRKTLYESEEFCQAKTGQTLIKNPFVELIKKYKLKILRLFGIFITTQVSFFVVFIFGKSLMIKFLGYDSYNAGKINLISVVSYTISTVIFGYLSDKIEKRKIILAGVIGILISAYPFILSLQSNASYKIIVLFSILMGMLIGMTEGTLNPLTAETFPVQIRATGIAFCWNFSSVVFGSLAPIISMYLTENCGGVNSVAFYLICTCIISLITLVRWKNRKQHAPTTFCGANNLAN